MRPHHSGTSSPSASPDFDSQPWTSPGRDAVPADPSRDPKTPNNFSAPGRVAPAARPHRATIQPGDELRTMVGGSGRELEARQKLLMVQFSSGFSGGAVKWLYLEQIKGEGLNIGRSSFRQATTDLEYLAADHLRIVVEGDQVFAEEGTTINGVYLMVPAGRPVELVSGTRFQVGEHVVEFQAPEPVSTIEPIIARDRERLRCRRIEPLAYLVFGCPDDGPGLRFPLTKAEGTDIGREGDISLKDKWSSRAHARVVARGDRFFLEDLDSTNGTFVRIDGRTPIRPANSPGFGDGRRPADRVDADPGDRDVIAQAGGFRRVGRPRRTNAHASAMAAIAAQPSGASFASASLGRIARPQIDRATAAEAAARPKAHRR